MASQAGIALEQQLRAYTSGLVQGAERANWEWHKSFETWVYPQRCTFSNKDTSPNPLKQPPTRKQVFKCLRLWDHLIQTTTFHCLIPIVQTIMQIQLHGRSVSRLKRPSLFWDSRQSLNCNYEIKKQITHFQHTMAQSVHHHSQREESGHSEETLDQSKTLIQQNKC